MEKTEVETIELEDEVVSNDSKKYTLLTSAYNDRAEYIGSEEDAKFICDKMGIDPICIDGNSVCSIGFCKKDNKWYGWSHRTIHGFGIGSEVKKGDAAYNPTDKKDFAENMRDFYHSEEYHEWTRYRSVENDEGVLVLEIEHLYNNNTPNEHIRGETLKMIVDFPESFGKGEWKAETLEDAKLMAIDFANNVC